jgi:glycosyltransferase involved in cell wall biosynthesis
VGEGAIRGELTRLAESCGVSDCVTFRGRVDDAALAELYARCDCFVLPAIVDAGGDTEGLGVVLLEAMSYRKPVIATRVGGIPDIVIDGQTGLLVEEKDPAGLAQAIRRVLDDPELAVRLGWAGAMCVQERCGWDRIVDAIEALYRGEEPAL